MPPAKRKTPEADLLALREELRAHDRRYYLDDAPTIADSEYDRLLARLREVESEHPELITSDSPTQRVGGGVGSDFHSVRHAAAMLSLDNAYEEADIRAWDERVRKNLPSGETPSYLVEPKIDGLSCALTYENGALTCAATRGDGETGEDVTANARTLRAIVLRLPAGSPEQLELRGEVYMTSADFDQVNQDERRAGREPFVNPRNCAAGSLRQKDPRITAGRRLRFTAHSYGVWKGGQEPSTHADFLSACRAMGLPASAYKRCANIDEVLAWHSAFKETELPRLAYAVDGLVVKVDSFAQQKRLGLTAKSPRWAIAFKYPAAQASSKIASVEFSVGRTGIITPVAKVEPVFCAGVTISSVTLHNFEEIARLGLRIGDRVMIERAGEVIPKIVKVVEHNKTGKIITPPRTCPDCGAAVVQEEGLVAYRCDNPSCPAQLRRTLEHFASRGAMDISGLGDSAIDQLVGKGYVHDVADIFSLTKEQLMSLDLFADKKADNLLAQILASKSRPLNRVLFALGLRHVGEKTADTITAQFDLDRLLTASIADFESLPEVGPVVANSLHAFFSSVAGRRLIEHLRHHGLSLKPFLREIPRDAPFSGMTFVFTGELTAFSRQDAEEKVKALGGKASASVSAKTSFVVAGDAAGSKLKKAQVLGVKVLTEKQFQEMLP